MAKPPLHIVLDYRDFLLGASTSDEIADGGFSPESKGINLFASPGLVLPGPEIETDTNDYEQSGIEGVETSYVDTAISGFILSIDATAGGAGDARVSSVIETSGAVSSMFTEGTKNYRRGESDIKVYKNNIYVTSERDITQSTMAGGSVDATWWGTTMGETLMSADFIHHMEVFGDTLYIADGNKLHSYDGTNSAYEALTLPTEESITTIKTFNNKLWIATDYYRGNVGGDNQGRAKLYTWDGYSASWIDEYPLHEKIDTLVPFSGMLYATTKDSFGYFNGLTFVPLRMLDYQVLKKSVAVMKDKILMVQGSDILCYGNPIKGRQRFFSFPVHYGDGTIDGILAHYQSSLFMSDGTSSLYVEDMNDPGTADLIFYGNKIPLGGFANIREFVVETEKLESGASFTFDYLTSQETTQSVGSLTFASDGAIAEKRLKISGQRPTLTIQPKVTFGGTVFKGLRRIHIYADESEKPPTS